MTCQLKRKGRSRVKGAHVGRAGGRERLISGHQCFPGPREDGPEMWSRYTDSLLGFTKRSFPPACTDTRPPSSSVIGVSTWAYSMLGLHSSVTCLLFFWAQLSDIFQSLSWWGSHSPGLGPSPWSGSEGDRCHLQAQLQKPSQERSSLRFFLSCWVYHVLSDSGRSKLKTAELAKPQRTVWLWGKHSHP